MIKYHQPDFYHFSEDSLFLVNKVLERISGRDNPLKILDAFCGCGIIGCEIMQKLPKGSECLFLEKQADFFGSLVENSRKISPNQKYRCLQEDFFEYQGKQEFDLILVNPPYYESSSSRPSKNSKKNMCQRLSREEREKFIFRLSQLLSTNGEAFFLESDSYPFPRNGLNCDLIAKRGRVLIQRIFN